MRVGIVQARLSSSRLPGKVLLPILGKPMILRQIERLRAAKQLDKLIVATTSSPEDDRLCQILEQEDIEFYRGDPSDVLDRFYQAAKHHHATTVVRLTGDCPLHDPEVV